MIDGWNGKSKLIIKADARQDIITAMIFGESEPTIELKDTCLLSNRGWSVYINTFGGVDPYYIGRVFLGYH